MAKKIKNEKELFDIFIEYWELRPKLNKPFFHARLNRVCASDGHIAILVNPDILRKRYNSEELRDSLLTDEPNMDCYITVEDLEKAIEELPRQKALVEVEKKCPECGGKGYVECEYHADYDDEDYYLQTDCPICDGEGVITEEEEKEDGPMIVVPYSSLVFVDARIRFDLIEKLCKACKFLGISDVHIIRIDASAENIFELSPDIHIVIMPMLGGNNKDPFVRVKLKLNNGSEI